MREYSQGIRRHPGKLEELGFLREKYCERAQPTESKQEISSEIVR